MLQSVLEFFNLLGLDMTEPTTAPAFFVWLLQTLFCFGVVWFILRMFRSFANIIFGAGKHI